MKYFVTWLIVVSMISVLAAATSVAGNRGTERGAEGGGKPQWLPHTVIVKFRAQASPALSRYAVALPSLTPSLMRYGVVRMTQMFPGRESRYTVHGREIAIQRLYRFEYVSEEDPRSVAAELAELPEVEYAEPEEICSVSYEPDDARLSEQYALNLVKAREAWDITTGDSTVVIAIVDSGVRWTHQDMFEHMWINPGEDVDGDGRFTAADNDSIDGDGNGYIDDVIGIDFVGPRLTMGGAYYDNDPNPTTSGHFHGTHVAGIAAGVGDNGVGIAGLAYNCRIMAVKCGADVYSPSIIRGYDGIVYAADNGADVINCSWGGGGYLESQIEMIDYAISKGAIVVAAAGNDGAERVGTPGAYPNVLCVANTDTGDKVAPSSTYGSWVDVSAPGTNILSLDISSDAAYRSATGTSMASPLVAGLAGLVKSRFPDMTPQQVSAQIRVTADDIDALQQSRYHGKIGKGRVNAYRALTESFPAILLADWSWTDSLTGNGDHILDRGEVFTVEMTWENILAPATNAVVTLSSTNPRVTIRNPQFTIGPMASGEQVGNAAAPFEIELEDSFAPNDRIDLQFTVEDGEYLDHGGVFLFQQPSYRDLDRNDVRITLTNDGNLGFDDMSGVMGSGLRYRDGGSVLFEGALMVGAIVNRVPLVVDVARGMDSGSQNTDFESQDPVEILTPGYTADQEGRVRFWDAGAPLRDRLQTEVLLVSYEFDRPEVRNMVFLKYRIHNVSANVQEYLHAGLMFDWDVSANAQSDFARFYQGEQTAVCFDSVGSPRVSTVAGVTLLSRDQPVHYWGINNRDSDDSMRIGIYNGFSKEEKWKAMTSEIVNPVSDITDVTQVISNGPYTMNPGDTVVIGFAVIMGESVGEVLAGVPTALAYWDTINRPYDPTGICTESALPAGIELGSISPHPVSARSGSATLRFDLPANSSVEYTVYDILGRERLQASAGEYPAGRHVLPLDLHMLPPGRYVLRVATGRGSATRGFMVRP